MKNIIDFMKQYDDFIGGKGVSEKEVLRAEKQLAVHFAGDYREYLLSFGTAMINGHELTGLGNSERVNVVSVTDEYLNRNHIEEIPKNWYVIDDTGIDGIITWQSSDGNIYEETSGRIKKISDSLMDYISKY